VNGSLLLRHVDTQLRSLERVGESDRDPITALRETVEAIWKVVERVASEPAPDAAWHDARALLARRELMQRATCVLSAVIQRGRRNDAVTAGKRSGRGDARGLAPAVASPWDGSSHGVHPQPRVPQDDRSCACSGSFRIRFPVAANTALASAGAVIEVPGSPIPPGASRFRTRCTSIVGASFIRNTR